MSQKILTVLGTALVLGVSPAALAQSSPPLIPPPGGAAASGQTNTEAGASAGSDAGAQAGSDAGAAAGSGDAGAAAGSGDAGAQQAPDAGAAPAPDSGAAPAPDAGAAPAPDAGAAPAPDAGAAPQSGSQPSAGASSDANVTVDVSSEQKTEIHQAITEVNVAPVTSVDFDVSVGVAVPKTIVLNPLPPTVIKIVPQFKGYLFFILPDGRIVIVEPSTLHIVYILSV